MFFLNLFFFFEKKSGDPVYKKSQQYSINKAGDN